MGNVLVTGGNGFLGRNLLEGKTKLGKRGYNVLSPKSSELDLMSYDDVFEYIKRNEVEVVIHLAASMSGIGELLEHPLKYYESNILINFNIVRASRELGIKKFITLGSSCGYNNDTPLPMKEESFWTLKPENTYGIAKLLMLEHLEAQSDMEWCYFIPGNLYGPYDHFGDTNAHLIPATVLKFEKAISNNENAIEVWGDGSQVRDFLYVKDMCKIIEEALDASIYDGEAINVSVEKGVTVKEIVLAIQKSMEMDNISIVWDESKPTGILKKIMSNARFLEKRHDFEFTKLEDGIRYTLDWYKTNREETTRPLRV